MGDNLANDTPIKIAHNGTPQHPGVPQMTEKKRVHMMCSYVNTKRLKTFWHED